MSLSRPTRVVVAALFAAALPACAESPRELSERLDRAVEAVVDLRDGRAAAARALYAKIEKIGEERHLRALHNVMIADGIELAKQARSMSAGDAGRSELLNAALSALEQAQPDHVAALEQRGFVKRELGDLAGSTRDLDAVVNIDPKAYAVRWDLARTRWRMGDRDAAVKLMDEGLLLASDRAAAEMFVRMLRGLARNGEGARATELAQRHLMLARGDEVKSAFHVYMAETNIAAKNLAAAMDSFVETQVADRTWLVGGLVRAGRELGQTEAGRKEVLTALNRLPKNPDQMPSSTLRLAGDLHAAAGRDQDAVRHYAASLTGGDEEAREIVGHIRTTAAKYATPGSVVNMMAAPSVMAPAFPLYADRFEGSIDPNSSLPAIAPLRGAPNERAAEILTASLPPAGQRTSQQIEAAVRSLTSGQQRPVTPTRAKLLAQVLAGQDEEVKSTLDALALTSWQVNNPRPLGFARAALPAAGAINVEPITRETQRPQSVDAVASALAELNDTTSTEKRRLARVMEVARQELEVPPIARDPIAIDCDASGKIEMTPLHDHSAAVRFDLEGWGNAARIQWLAGKDGWLCEDTDHDGQIASGRELFGTAGGFSDGFEKLALRDTNHDGKVEGEELAGLSVWIDADNQGVTDPGELTPVEVAGLTSISIPRVGLRAQAILKGQKRLCLEVWPEAFAERFASW